MLKIKDARLASIKQLEYTVEIARPTKYHGEIDDGVAGEQLNAIKRRWGQKFELY